MTRVRAAWGLIAGVILVLSSGAHSLLGWKQVRAELVVAHVPTDLLLGLAISWHFGGVAMLAFGCLVVTIFAKRLRGQAAPSWPALVIGVTYIAFGAWALVVSNLNPFFSIFVVPGLLLAVAAFPERQPSAGR